jgi:hypothetical protein
MCTVSVYPSNDSLIFTSNRDEKIVRSISTHPEVIEKNNTKYFFSRDASASGTWFVISDKGTIAILLNGAFEKHTSKAAYEKSRGIVLLELMYSNEIVNLFMSYSLVNIEPFQLVVYENNFLCRLIWDGESKHHITLDKDLPHLFSSVTLYDKETIFQREIEFDLLQKNHQVLSKNLIFDFHLTKKISKSYSDTGITNEHKTFSISQAVFTKQDIHYAYHDLILDTVNIQEIKRY